MHKKTWSLLLAFFMLAALFSTQVSAESKSTTRDDLKVITEEYLKKCTYDMQRGLYTVTVQCRDKNPTVYSDSTVVENSVQIRIY